MALLVAERQLYPNVGLETQIKYNKNIKSNPGKKKIKKKNTQQMECMSHVMRLVFPKRVAGLVVVPIVADKNYVAALILTCIATTPT